MADNANNCPLCDKPLSNGHCEDCGYYNDNARVAIAHSERAERAQRQAQGDAGYKNIIDDRRDAANPPPRTNNSTAPQSNKKVLTVVMIVLTLITPFFGLIAALVINSVNKKNGGTDNLIDMRLIGGIFAAGLFLIFIGPVLISIFD